MKWLIFRTSKLVRKLIKSLTAEIQLSKLFFNIWFWIPLVFRVAGRVLRYFVAVKVDLPRHDLWAKKFWELFLLKQNVVILLLFKLRLKLWLLLLVISLHFEGPILVLRNWRMVWERRKDRPVHGINIHRCPQPLCLHLWCHYRWIVHRF